VVGADLEGLVSPHDQASLAVLLVLEKSDIAGSPLLPLPALAVELEQLSPHLESLLLGLLVGLGVDLLSKVHDRLEVNIGLLLLGLLVIVTTLSSLLLLCLCRARAVVLLVLVVLLSLLLGTAAEHGEHVLLGRGGRLSGGLGDSLLLLGRGGGGALGVLNFLSHLDGVLWSVGSFGGLVRCCLRISGSEVTELFCEDDKIIPSSERRD